MFLIYIFLFILLLGFISFLIQKFRKDKKYNRKFYDFEDNTSVVLLILILICTFFCVNFFIDDPVFTDPSEKIAYGRKTAQPWLESTEYGKQVQKNQEDLELQIKFIKSHFDENQDMGPSASSYNGEGASLFNSYTLLSKSPDRKKADIGELALGIYYYYRDDHLLSLDHLEKVKNNKLKYLNTYLGIQYYYYNQPNKSKQCFAKEIRLYGDIQGAYYHLSGIYDYEKNYAEIVPFAYNDAIKQYIPYSFRQRAYITHHDVYNYFRTLLARYYAAKINIIGFIGAFLILLVWVFYLKSVNVYQKKNWLPIIFTVVLSALFVLPVWLLYDTYEYLLGFDLNGKVINDFLYCVFGIGVIEELVKFVPFLIILKFTKVIKEPIDYIMYASLSALGFAFVENCNYFDQNSINIIHSRALTASVAHMIFSSIAAYGLILGKFRYKNKIFLFGLLFFFIAALGHGFYDFWLMNQLVSGYFIFTFLCLLTGILVYSSFINNALNHSLTSGDMIKLNTSKLASDLAAGLLAVFLFEYIALVFIYGPTIGNREFIGSTLKGGYLILFCAVRLSNIDIIPGLWAGIEYFSGFLPGQIVYGDKKPNYNSLVGKRINIRLFRKKTLLEALLPVEGEIIKREQIAGFTGWFLVKLDQPLAISKSNKEFILIRAKEHLGLIRKNEDTMVSFTLIPDLVLLENGNKKLKDFKFIDWAVAIETIEKNNIK
jgi:RsiW-degrading membrane proteinase PrsW (M82 family)